MKLSISDNDMSKPVHPGAKEVEEEQEDMSPKHRAPNHEQLTLMVTMVTILIMLHNDS